MALHFSEEKATQAAARLIRSAGGRINHMKLIKLLYIAERRALLKWGRPITFDAYVSMPHGPVLSFTLDKVNEPVDPARKSYWQHFISERTGHEVRLLAEAPNDQLSRAEEQLLDEVFAEFGGMTPFELRDYTHTLPEWHDPQGSSTPIRIRDILLAEGLSDDNVADVEEQLRAEAAAARYAAG
jgi:uncharacterized phage-associated protein